MTASLECASATVVSPGVTLDVLCAADINGDGAVDGFDIEVFMTHFESGSPEADVDNDGFVDAFDVEQFVGSFEEGC